ncbi:uncharacterized protein [Physcomitrium patens]|uniref:Uncharacterized protein n=1 Tax=Physcomitrium patens TaxID=3218 RepID=A0A2K1IIK6_PHYPA|nr:uncharacterized protein LOC112275471 [Physcomitrium patens]XP_024361576.1 uncharacterized protein LOC112275471 [Physcomitrium patens]PNR29105.1 hypothetical protein PHYPA_027797 [Physcomitrium patens]|eukprot:XP_024361575.1 uncharacterized protein LOC112275471 [Physcomitrella patens]
MGVKAFVHRGLIILPTECRSPPFLMLRIGRYDGSQENYVPINDDGGSLTLPLAGDEHVAALDSVGCRKTGLMCTCLVLASRERLRIGRLDIENSTYEVAGSISLAEEGDVGECLQCWLVDGPTLVAWFGSKVVVASDRQEHILPYLAFERHSCSSWKADMLEGSFQRVFVAENQVLCVSSVAASASSSAQYANLQCFTLPSENQVGRYSPTLTEIELPLEVDPCSITCVAYLATTLNLSYKVVFGTSEGRLKCCSRGKVVMEVTLEDSPLSVHSAEAAHGVQVLVVSLGGMDRKVVTLFADSLRQINAWTGVQQVIVDDLAGIGHDQMLLVTQPLSSTASFEHCLRISLLEFAPQSAGDKHKSNILKSVNEALEIRLQDGMKEVQETEQRRSDKMLMLSAACNLMQSIAVHQLGSKIEDMIVPDDAVCMESIQVQEAYMGRWFLVINVNVNKNVPEGFHLRRPTLFATSLLGFVKSMASRLPSQANLQSFLFSFPIKDCHFPLHIILAAEASGNKNMSSAWDPVGASFNVQDSQRSKNYRTYTQWIHTIDTIDTDYESNAAGFLGTHTALCERWISLMGGADSPHHLSVLVKAVSMHTTSGNYTWGSYGSSKECERQYVTEGQTKAPLSSMYMHDVSLARNIVTTNFLGTLSKLYGPRLAEMVVQFADVVLEEIHSYVNEGSDACLAELQAATDRCLCHLLSSITYNSFGDF